MTDSYLKLAAAALAYPFWSARERRLRAFWRLAIHAALMTILLLPALWLAYRLNQIDLTGRKLTTEICVAIQAAAVCLGTVISVYVCGRFLDRRAFADFGLHLNWRWTRDLALGVAIGGVLMAGIFIFELAAGWLTIDSVCKFEGLAHFLVLPVSFVTFSFVGFYEELMSRGYHMRNMSEGFRFGGCVNCKAARGLAALMASAVFAVMHLGNPGASVVSTVGILGVALLLALSWLITDELALPIGLHIGWNFFQGPVFGFPVSGVEQVSSAFTITQHGPVLATGGVFGPEAGLIGLAASALGMLLLVVIFGKRSRR